MPRNKLSGISATQKKRLSHIDFRLNFLGEISRNDLIGRFGIKEAAATRDLAEYKRHVPENLSYNATAKMYIRSRNFEPLFEYPEINVLTALAHGFGEAFIEKPKALIACETPTQLNKPSLKVLSALTRAIYRRKALSITYRSLSSGKTTREIIPFALVDNGVRWHVRAYDRKRSIFTDFVTTRISDPSIIESPVADHETRDHDNQWNRIVELEISAHPRLKHPETIEYDYGMIDGLLRVNVRAAVAGYVLRRWNVDCSENHSLNGKEIHLRLNNKAALYGVENILLAPGYKDEQESHIETSI